MKLFITIIFSLLTCSSAVAQFSPQAGVAGSEAISANDNNIVAWANACVLQRGWQNIADKSKGKTTIGVEQDALGKRNGSLLSLGDSGVATLTFDGLIYNGPGADIAVFENGFANPNNPEEAFLEFAFVEVSSDGINFVRFPASCHIDSPQIPGAGVYANARKVNNLAGKHIAGYGTPFDLEELKDSTGLDVNKITHVRIVDAVGNVAGGGSVDSEGKPINDPYPTPFMSGGFDLDAVAAIHVAGKWPQGISNIQGDDVHVSPNPATTHINISMKGAGRQLLIIDVAGRVMHKNYNTPSVERVDISNFPQGIYYLKITDANGVVCTRHFTKY